MKELVKGQIGKGSSDLNTYHIFDNPNKEIKAAIQEFKVDESYVLMGWPERKWTIAEWEEEEVKCMDGRNVQYFKAKDVRESLEKRKIQDINDKWDIYKLFNSLFGVVTYTQEEKKNEYDTNELRKFVARKEQGIWGRGNDATSVGHMFDFYSFGFHKWGNELELRAETPGGLSTCIYFNEEGDIVNRDYNESFHLWESKDVSPMYLLEKFRKYVLDLPITEMSKDIFFGEDMAYTVDMNERFTELNVYFHEKQEYGNKYDGACHRKSFHKPKRLQSATPKDMMDYIERNMPEEFWKRFEN